VWGPNSGEGRGKSPNFLEKKKGEGKCFNTLSINKKRGGVKPFLAEREGKKKGVLFFTRGEEGKKNQFKQGRVVGKKFKNALFFGREEEGRGVASTNSERSHTLSFIAAKEGGRDRKPRRNGKGRERFR